MVRLRTVGLVFAGLVLLGGQTHAQTQGVLQAPKPGSSKPEPAPTPPKAAPVAPVARVAPMNEQSALGKSTPGKPPPVVAPARNAHAQKPAVKTPAVKKPVAKKPAPPAKPADGKPAAAAAIAATTVAASAAIAVKPAEPAPPPAPPAEKPSADPTKGSVTGQPLPRWAALRSDVVNLRRGPNQRYPIDWEYHRRDLPVLIQREFEVWRLVTDQDGVQGWVHSATLTGRRSFVVKGADATLRSRGRPDADAVATLKAGVIGHIEACAATADWCEVSTGGYKGWLPRTAMWGISPGEAVGG